MWSFREILIFLAGAELFHTFSHFMLWYCVPTYTCFSIMMTPNLMFLAGIINALITVFLFWWISKLK